MIKCGRPRKGEELLSRDRLLDTAFTLFLEFGYGNLSLETIARDARVSMRTIYNQFGGKAGLFGAVIRRCSDQFVTGLSEEYALKSSPEEALVFFAKQFLYSITRPNAVRIRAILIGESLRFPDLATQFYEQGPQRTLDHLAQFFARQQKTGCFAEMEPRFLADQLLSALRNERFQKLQLGLEPTPDEAEIDVWVRQAIGFFLRGSLKNRRDGTNDIVDEPSDRNR
ncbi:TetR/AcrR family transcriptional regulator [Methylobacter tundripaludum]|uniref:Regulatory protein TetR n=1 Tax=Methylobacter tundripaludum (strain ATCC BAA-1195 / DSM 17260 / SV96) TaxID=697282 RepID=G3ITM8_METTV|nr:TetR/AcrR family transcriptional regulator [Methylobacter tundripaludum]EGW21438.1 regulatory protein TetR [Methylobacter tundripaludum SV96]